MDWAAHLLGLSPAFYNASGIGGGAIQVRPTCLVGKLGIQISDILGRVLHRNLQ
jgi:hypothetical protein